MTEPAQHRKCSLCKGSTMVARTDGGYIKCPACSGISTAPTVIDVTTTDVTPVEVKPTTESVTRGTIATMAKKTQERKSKRPGKYSR